MYHSSMIDPGVRYPPYSRAAFAIDQRRKFLSAIAALDADAPTAAAVTAAGRDALAPDDVERRRLTVMFCDLVGSTALAARLDPEDHRRRI
jgi:class 3 adenylate cyclase